VADVFISYSRQDKDLVRALHDAFSAQKRDTWVDWEDIPPTAEWLKEIFSAIEAAHTFVFVISPDSITSEVCKQETAHAAKHNKRLVPIVRREVDYKDVPEALAKLNYIFFREADDFDPAFQSLITALDTDLDWVRAHTRLLTRAIEWDIKGRDKSFVLHGRDLTDAEQWLAQTADKEPKPTSLQSQHILSSRQDATRRQRITLGAVTVGLVVAIVLGVVAFIQRQIAEERRQIATSRQLAAQALTQLDDELDLAFLLSLEANRISGTVEARHSLLAALQYSPHLIKFLRAHKDFVGSVAFSPDGKTLASGSRDSTIILWDVATRQPLGAPLTGHKKGATSVAFNPDGKTLASGSGDETVILWDLATRQPLGPPLTGHKGLAESVAFNPDGKTLASGSGDETVILWDLATRQPLGLPLTGHKGSVRSVAFSPDGKTLASGGADATVILWDVDPASWAERACRTANRNMTIAEWRQYLGDEPYRKTCPNLPGPEEEKPRAG
jgi:hypothetical protein